MINLIEINFSGQSPMEADLNLLETARRCELFGVKMHPVKVNSFKFHFQLDYMAVVVEENLWIAITSLDPKNLEAIRIDQLHFILKKDILSLVGQSW